MAPNRPPLRLVLASGSPHRRALLAGAGLTFEVRTAPVDESTIRHPVPRELARLRAEGKGRAAAAVAASSGDVVIGADQVASFGGAPFDKAVSLVEARQRLRDLSGCVHFLHSAYALFQVDAHGQGVKLLQSRVFDVEIKMRAYSSSEIEAYLATGEWQGCVGCYQFENKGVNLIERVSADHSTIIGLPLLPLLRDLRELGISAI